jgi:aspartate aminotransferase-like enzyme
VKTYLMTPGPTEVPPDTLLELARPVFHHRTPEFSQVLTECTELLREVLQTSGDIFLIAGSGTAAMEACLGGALTPGETALCVRGGKFGERWSKICAALGITTVDVDVEWGSAVEPEEIGRLLEANPEIRAVCVQLCETSTATVTDVEAIGRLTRDRDTLLIVDGVSSVGALEYRMDDWGVDLTAVGSQKALMMPPGLAIVAAGKKAMETILAHDPPGLYLDLRAAKKAADKASTPYTPAVNLVVGLLRSLRRIHEEGIENVWARHALLGRALRAGVQALGLGLLSNRPADCVTAVALPDEVDGVALLETCEKDYGVKFAGGQEQLKGKIIRISTMGYSDRFDVVTALAALEMALTTQGVEVELGFGVRAAEEVFLDT